MGIDDLLAQASSEADISPSPSHKKTKLRAKKRRREQPDEVSSKKYVFPSVASHPAKRRHRPRDPRFDELCGTYTEAIHRQNFAFVDDYKRQELEAAKKKMRKTKNKEAKVELRQHAARLNSQLKQQEQKDRLRKMRSARRKEEMELVKQGKKPYYMKKSALKKMEIIDTYDEKKSSGSLSRFMEKRRKRNAAKDRRKLPRASNARKGHSNGSVGA